MPYRGSSALSKLSFQAQDAKVKTAMELLELKVNKLGPTGRSMWDRYCG